VDRVSHRMRMIPSTQMQKTALVGRVVMVIMGKHGRIWLPLLDPNAHEWATSNRALVTRGSTYVSVAGPAGLLHMRIYMEDESPRAKAVGSRT